MKTYHYKISKTGWGIFISITANVYTNIEYNNSMFKIDNNFYVDFSEVPLITSDKIKENLLVSGISWVKKYIKFEGSMVLKIHKLDINFTDFQNEGLYYAIAFWLSKYFTFEMPHYNCYFNKESNTYIFPDIVPIV